MKHSYTLSAETQRIIDVLNCFLDADSVLIGELRAAFGEERAAELYDEHVHGPFRRVCSFLYAQIGESITERLLISAEQKEKTPILDV